MHKIITGGLMLILFFGFLSQSAFAQTKSDWSSVISKLNSEVAIKSANGQTVFGKLTSANEDEITIQLADKKGLTSQTSKFRRNDVKKVWLAQLKSGKGLDRSAATLIGAGAGAAVGAGIGLASLGATGGSDSGASIVAGLAAAGAGIGAVAGYFTGKGGHKKMDLIYET